MAGLVYVFNQVFSPLCILSEVLRQSLRQLGQVRADGNLRAVGHVIADLEHLGYANGIHIRQRLHDLSRINARKLQVLRI